MIETIVVTAVVVVLAQIINEVPPFMVGNNN